MMFIFPYHFRTFQKHYFTSNIDKYNRLGVYLCAQSICHTQYVTKFKILYFSYLESRLLFESRKKIA